MQEVQLTIPETVPEARVLFDFLPFELALDKWSLRGKKEGRTDL